MAACGFGASGLKITNLGSGSLRPKLTTLHPFNAFTTRKYNTLSLSNTSRKAITRCLSQADLAAAADLEGDSEETDSSEARSSIIPNSFEVESLLTTLCDTSIAEFELKLQGFRLYVTRDLVAQAAPSPPPAPGPASASVTAPTVIKTPVSNGSALALSRPVPSSDAVQALLDKAADEGLVILQSPKVGFFRRSRTIKGKKAPPSCKEKDTVKEGQVLCYIEQLGGEIPIESDTVGEVVKILRKDGDPIGYGDALMAILPSFPGIKKLQ